MTPETLYRNKLGQMLSNYLNTEQPLGDSWEDDTQLN